MTAYAEYIDVRIRTFKDLQHDLVRVQTESNRRSDGLGAGCELDAPRYQGKADECSESKAIAAFTGRQRFAAGGQGSPEDTGFVDQMSRKLLAAL